MLKPFKISVPAESAYLCSDLHWGHDKGFIYEPRGFKTVQDHNATLSFRWNERVTDQDTVIHLGDLMVGCPDGDFWSLMRQLRFRHLVLMLGNHNAHQRQAYEELVKLRFPDLDDLQGGISAEVYPLTATVDGNPAKEVTFLPEYAEVSVSGQRIVLCHYGIRSWHHMGKLVPHFYGHSHSALEHYPRCRDVGIEAYGGPVSLTRLLKEMEDEKPAKVDHH